MSTTGESDDLDRIVRLHRRSRGRSEACVCGEAYPCSTVGLVVTVREQSERIAELEAVVLELCDHGVRHHLSYESHDHDCYEEWAALRDEARKLVRGGA